jgi:hypothetical protein
MTASPTHYTVVARAWPDYNLRFLAAGTLIAGAALPQSVQEGLPKPPHGGGKGLA